MKKNTTFMCAGLISALLTSPVFAGKSSDDTNDRQGSYKKHYAQRHQMNTDMMQILSETMTILRDINHQPSAEEKARLSDMIKQLDKIMATQKKMGEKAMQRMDKKMGHDDDDDDDHHGKR